MKPVAILLSAGLCLGASLVMAGSPVMAQNPPPSEETPEMFPAGPHRDETFYFCVACHNFKLTAAQGMSREKWDETLSWMTSRHNMPPIEGDDRKNMLDYLAKAFPPKAPAQQGWTNPFLN